VACIVFLWDVLSLAFFLLAFNRTLEHPRMGVRKIRFAPGKGNSKLLILFTTRLEIREMATVREQLGSGKGILNVTSGVCVLSGRCYQLAEVGP